MALQECLCVGFVKCVELFGGFWYCLIVEVWMRAGAQMQEAKRIALFNCLLRGCLSSRGHHLNWRRTHYIHWNSQLAWCREVFLFEMWNYSPLDKPCGIPRYAHGFNRMLCWPEFSWTGNCVSNSLSPPLVRWFCWRWKPRDFSIVKIPSKSAYNNSVLNCIEKWSKFSNQSHPVAPRPRHRYRDSEQVLALV